MHCGAAFSTKRWSVWKLAVAPKDCGWIQNGYWESEYDVSSAVAQHHSIYDPLRVGSRSQNPIPHGWSQAEKEKEDLIENFLYTKVGPPDAKSSEAESWDAMEVEKKCPSHQFSAKKLAESQSWSCKDSLLKDGDHFAGKWLAVQICLCTKHEQLCIWYWCFPKYIVII